jgi:ABC-type antimicrobial peptide transport system permease subunit
MGNLLRRLWFSSVEMKLFIITIILMFGATLICCAYPFVRAYTHRTGTEIQQ